MVLSDGGAPAGRPCAALHTGSLTVTRLPPPPLRDRTDMVNALVVRALAASCPSVLLPLQSWRCGTSRSNRTPCHSGTQHWAGRVQRKVLPAQSRPGAQAWQSQPAASRKRLLHKAETLLLSDSFSLKLEAFAAGIADSVAVAHHKVAWALQPTPIDVAVKLSRLKAGAHILCMAPSARGHLHCPARGSQATIPHDGQLMLASGIEVWRGTVQGDPCLAEIQGSADMGPLDVRLERRTLAQLRAALTFDQHSAAAPHPPKSRRRKGSVGEVKQTPLGRHNVSAAAVPQQAKQGAQCCICIDRACRPRCQCDRMML